MVQRSDPRPVFLAPETERTLKNRLLAPFFPRYRTFLALEEEPKPLRGPYRNMILSDDARFLLVRNPKCGCTSVMQLMYYRARGAFYPRTIHRATSGILMARYHWPEVKSVLLRGSAYLFSTTRHPVPRIYSAFRNFFVDQTNLARRKHLGPMRAHGFSETKPEAYNFEVFLDYAAHGIALDAHRVDAHWRRQVDNLGIGRLAYDRIVKLEDLAETLPEVFAAGGAPGFPSPEILAARFNRTKGGPPPVTMEQRRKIEALYAEDFAAFGYS